MNPHPPLIWVEQTRVHSYDADPTRAASLEAVCRLFMEAAWNHAEALGVGFERLREQGKLWVLSRLSMRCDRSPRWGCAVTLRTWPRATRTVFAMRDFEVLEADNNGTPLIVGSSAWLVIDAHSRKPMRSDKVLAGMERLCSKLAAGQDPERLLDLPDFSSSTSILTRYSDLDVNGHVNSGRYVAYLLDVYGPAFHRDHRVASVDINYLAETRVGEVLRLASTEVSPGVWCHRISRADGGEVCRSRIRWAPRA